MFPNIIKYFDRTFKWDQDDIIIIFIQVMFPNIIKYFDRTFKWDQDDIII